MLTTEKNLNRMLELEPPGLGRKDWHKDWLWIDALCIDQSDACERLRQVGIMSEIFRIAG
jgi:hypothetical protein